jgi:hypothetical protein
MLNDRIVGLKAKRTLLFEKVAEFRNEPEAQP